MKYIVNTHYHPDHQGGNSVVGPDAVVISTDWTRDHTISMSRAQPAANASRFRPARLTFTEALTLHIDPYLAKVYFPGKAHTSGDALVYFPEQRSIATGDLFLTRSSPAMDEGSVKNWIHALDQVLGLPSTRSFPGRTGAARVEGMNPVLDATFIHCRVGRVKNKSPVAIECCSGKLSHERRPRVSTFPGKYTFAR